MKTPTFWNSINPVSNLLLPFSFLYELVGTLQRAYTKPIKFSVPIVCIGNLTSGGSGKTPVALHIGKILKEKNTGAFFLTRGYGGTQAGPLLVHSKKHSAHDVGDEPLLLAEILPTVVAKNRVQGAHFAVKKGARIIVMDDGFQNPTIAKTLSIVVIDGKIGFGNGRLVPAGPLRERPSAALKRAHAVIIVGASASIDPLPKGLLVLHAKSQLVNVSMFKGKKIFAFCGLAYPHKFFDMLESTGAKIMGSKAFPDHYPYRDIDLKKLLAQSILHDAALVTTPKDFIKLPQEFKECVAVVDIDITFNEPSILDNIIHFILNPA